MMWYFAGHARASFAHKTTLKHGRRVFDTHLATIERQLETLLQIEALRQGDPAYARRYQTPDMAAA